MNLSVNVRSYKTIKGALSWHFQLVLAKYKIIFKLKET